MSTNQIASHFGRSLPLARLTTHDPRLVQVITTPSSHLALGDFGLKSPLRAATAPGTKQGSVRYVQVKEQDRNDVGSAGAGGGSATANWREREHEVMLLRRWEEAGVGIKVGSGEQSSSGSSTTSTGVGAGLSYPSSSYSPSSASASSAAPSGGNAPQAPLPVSRFDRSSRRPLPTDTTIPAIAEDEEAAALLLSTATSRYSTSPSRLPNYLTLPEKDFQRLLEAIREHRNEFLQGLYTALAERVREDKLQAACEEYDAQEKPQGSRPTLQDFSLDEEIATLRRQQGHGSGEEDADAERLLVDMFDLARSRVASVEASAYLRRFLSARGLDDGDASSTELPDVDVRVNGRRSSADAQDGEAGAGAAKGARLHPLGGLQYGQPDKIFSATLAPALPGRVIGTRGTRSLYGGSSSSSASAKDSSLLIASGSRVYEARKSYAPKLSIYDATGQNTKQGTSLWRLYDARLVNENPSRWSLVERRVADKKAAWDRERGWSLAELGLGYVSASARSVLEGEVERNGFAAKFRGKAEVNANAGDGVAAAGPAVGAGIGAAAAAAAWNRMPGSPAWVGDLSFSENSQAQKDSSRSSYVGRGTSGKSYLGRSRYTSPSSANGSNASSAAAAAAEKHGQLTGQLAAYPQRGANGNRNRVNVSRSAAQRRSGLLGQGQQGEGEGENKKGASFNDDVSSLLGLDGAEGKKGGQ